MAAFDLRRPDDRRRLRAICEGERYRDHPLARTNIAALDLLDRMAREGLARITREAGRRGAEDLLGLNLGIFGKES